MAAVHRSHWVSLSHVEDIVTCKGAMGCILSNGLRLPVSRRHRKAMKLGMRDNLCKAVVGSIAAASATPPFGGATLNGSAVNKAKLAI